MWENVEMEIRKGTKSVSFITLPEIKGAVTRAAARAVEMDLEGVKDPSERYQPTHHVEAVMCWFLTQPPEVQDRITIEGRAIARRLKERPSAVRDFGPGTFPEPSAAPAKPGEDRGRDTVGRATTVPELAARLARESGGGAKGQKKRPKSNRRPRVRVD